jgi:hypothetical protein
MYPIRNFPLNLFTILILSSELCSDFPSGLYPSELLIRTVNVHLIFTMRNKCPAHLILPEAINLRAQII